MDLPDDDPKAFSSFVRWLYTGKVEQDPDPIPLAQAWILGDKLGCRAFSDRALLEILEYHQGSSLKATTIQFAYINTPEGSKLRKWVLDEFLFTVRRGLWGEFDDAAIKALSELDDWGLDLTKALVSSRFDHPLNPNKNPELYMEALDGGVARSLLRLISSASISESRTRSLERSNSIGSDYRGRSISRTYSISSFRSRTGDDSF